MDIICIAALGMRLYIGTNCDASNSMDTSKGRNASMFGLLLSLSLESLLLLMSLLYLFPNFMLVFSSHTSACAHYVYGM
jgi:hypothetical protein